jgi:hypothetical protein
LICLELSFTYSYHEIGYLKTYDKLGTTNKSLEYPTPTGYLTKVNHMEHLPCYMLLLVGTCMHSWKEIKVIVIPVSVVHELSVIFSNITNRV